MTSLVFPMIILWNLSQGVALEDEVVDDFARFATALNREVRIVDLDGAISQGLLTAVDPQSVTVMTAGGSTTIPRRQIRAADRMVDSPKDGLIKGFIFGAIVAGLPTHRIGPTLAGGAICGLLGGALDAARGLRDPIYRAPQPTLRISVKF